MRRLAALALILLLAACTNPVVKADVTRFHSGPAPTRFTIVAEPGQVGSLEFQQYASQVADALAAQGWRPVAPGGDTDTLVTITWGSGAPETETWQSPSSVYTGMGWGGRSNWYGGGFYEPFPYWETRSVTTYPLWLAVRMVAAGPSQRPVLFEGRAVADRKSREITPVMPYLVRALFTGFPGTTGTTVRVVVPITE